MQISIVKVGIERWKEIQEIGRQTFFESFADQNSEEDMQKYLDEEYSEASVLKQVNNPNSNYFLVYFETHLIGFIKLNILEAQTEKVLENALEIQRIYILNQYQNLKIGEKLLNFAADFAAKSDKENLWLGVWEHNTRAIKFYERNGFEVFDKHNFLLGGDLQTDLLLKREI